MKRINVAQLTTLALAVVTAIASAPYFPGVDGAFLIAWSLLIPLAAVTPFAWLCSAGDRTPSMGTLIIVGANTFLVGHFLFDPAYFPFMPFAVMALFSVTYGFARKLVLPLVVTSVPIVAVVLAHRIATSSLGVSTEAAMFLMFAAAMTGMILVVTGFLASVAYWVLAALVGTRFPAVEPRLSVAASTRIGYAAASIALLLGIAIGFSSDLEALVHPAWYLQLLAFPFVGLLAGEMYLRRRSSGPPGFAKVPPALNYALPPRKRGGSPGPSRNFGFPSHESPGFTKAPPVGPAATRTP